MSEAINQFLIELNPPFFAVFMASIGIAIIIGLVVVYCFLFLVIMYKKIRLHITAMHIRNNPRKQVTTPGFKPTDFK